MILACVIKLDLSQSYEELTNVTLKWISMAIFINSYKSENSSPKYVKLNFLLCGAQLVG